MCLEKVKSLSCNKNLSIKVLADFGKIHKDAKNNTNTTSIKESSLLSNVNSYKTALPFAVVQINLKNSLVNCKMLFDQGSQVTLI